MARFKIIYDAEVVGLGKEDESIVAKNLGEAKKIAEQNVADPEFIDEHLEPVILAKVKKVEEVI